VIKDFIQYCLQDLMAMLLKYVVEVESWRSYNYNETALCGNSEVIACDDPSKYDQS
jgi:hypothetical protein